MMHAIESIQRSLCLMSSCVGIILAALPERNDLAFHFVF